MDTAVLKSWCEVVRRTDPLIWALALEPQAEGNIDSLLLSLPSSSSLSPPSPALLASATVAAGSGLGAGSDAALEDMKAAKRKMFSLLRNSYCKSLAGVSQPQNAIDWLKCLVQTSSTTTHDELYLKHNLYHLPRTRRSIDVALEEAMTSSRTSGASGEQQENTPTGLASGSITGSTTGSGSAPGSPSLTAPGSSTTASNTHQLMTTNNSHNNNNIYYATTFNWMYYATTPEPVTAATRPSTRFGSRNEDHAEASSPTSGNTVGGLGVGGAIISPSIATAATAAVASHIAREHEALGGGASASAALSSGGSGGELQGSAESINNSDSLVNSNSSSSSMDSAITNHTLATATATPTAIATATTTTPSTTNKSPPQSLPARFITFFPQASTITLASTTQFLHSSLLSTKDATTAFLYRTFSPTYRICTLYKSSFTDGSQLRGLTRIKDSVMRPDAVVLVKSSMGQMRDVWGMVMYAYGVKAKMAGEKKRKEEREKVVREGREKVVRGVMTGRKRKEEKKKSGGEEEEEGKEGGIGGKGGELE